MKKILMLATAAFLFTGVAFAHGGDDKKKCAKGKECCKTEAKDKDCAKDNHKEKACCKKDAKEAKTATTTKKVATKKA